jgi:hypothetical protein
MAAGEIRGRSRALEDDGWMTKAEKKLDRWADELEDARIVRERDIRIGRAFDHARTPGAKALNDDYYSNLGRMAREAVDSERNGESA